MADNVQKLYTDKLTNGSKTFLQADGYKRISVYNSKNSTHDGTILGTGVHIESGVETASSEVDVEPGVAATIINVTDAVESVVITSPNAGTELNIMATS